MTRKEYNDYINRLGSKLVAIEPQGRELLDEERAAFLAGNDDELAKIRQECDRVWAKIRRLEEEIAIAQTVRDTIRPTSMRDVLAQLVREQGETQGKATFEWYCKTYSVTVLDAAPASISHEVFGL